MHYSSPKVLANGLTVADVRCRPRKIALEERSYNSIIDNRIINIDGEWKANLAAVALRWSA